MMIIKHSQAGKWR